MPVPLRRPKSLWEPYPPKGATVWACDDTAHVMVAMRMVVEARRK